MEHPGESARGKGLSAYEVRMSGVLDVFPASFFFQGVFCCHVYEWLI